MNQPKNHYETLGVSKDATQPEIKKAYRKLSLQHHPDKTKNDEKSSALYIDINEAYQTLGDVEKRQHYDMGSNNPFGSHGFGGGHGGHGGMPNDLFSMFFGGIPTEMSADMFANNPNVRIFRNGVPVNTVQKPPPIAMVATISIKEAFAGCKIPVVIERWIKDDNIKVVETETVYINLCKGVDNNEKMILKDKGNVVSERNKSDVILTIRVVNDTSFKRSGLNLVLNKPISLKESLCGFCFDLEHINGKKFKINNDRGTIIPPNYTKVINSMGMVRDNHVGNLIINFTIDYPIKLTDEQIEQLSKIL